MSLLRLISGSSSGSRNSKNSSRNKNNESKVAATPDGGACCGFNTTVEKETLVLDPKLIAPYSLPQEALTYSPTGDAIVQTFGKRKERKLHCNVELHQDELEKLKLLQGESTAQGKSFSPSICTSATRYLAHTKGDYKKALQMMEATQEWRQEYFAQPLNASLIMDDMRHGIVYFLGRDCDLRPTLVFRARRIPAAWTKTGDLTRVVRVALFCVEYFLRYMVVPGRVEQFNTLVDLNGVALSQIPVGCLRDLASTFGGHYVGRGGKFFVCNMSWVLRPMVNVAKGVLTERQASKLIFVNKVSELRSYFALHQLEQDLGGSVPVAQTFLPFPLQQGPFTAGCRDGPAANRIPGAHEVLTADGVRGRLWDPLMSREENTQLQYTDKAAGIFKACGLPIPPGCNDINNLLGSLPQIVESMSTNSYAAGAGSSSVEVPDKQARVPMVCKMLTPTDPDGHPLFVQRWSESRQKLLMSL